MILKSIVSLSIISLLLAACALPTPTDPAQTENPPYPPAATGTAISYPAPVVPTAVPTSSTYPAPATPEPGSPLIPPSGYEPLPGDDSLTRDPIFLELATSQLLVTATQPVQVEAALVGNLPDSCHHLRVIVTPPDTSNSIKIDAYSLADPAATCLAVLEPFTASIPLGSYSSGQYTVMVNGQQLGQFAASYAPQPGDDQLTRSEVFMDLAASKLETTDAQPNEVSAVLAGSMPTPCHQLRIALKPADAENKINLEVYSVISPGTNCIQMIQPFQVIFPLGSFSSGHYSVFVNGQLLGEFDG